MKIRFLCAVGTCLTGAALALAQAPEFKPARSFTFDQPATPYVPPRRPVPPPPLPAPVQAVHKETVRPAPPAVKPASSVTYERMPSDAANPADSAEPMVHLPMPQSLPLSRFSDMVDPVTITDNSAAEAIDGGVFEEGCMPAYCDGKRAWVSADALMWWLKDSPIAAPLVTRGTSAGRGVLGQPDTLFLAGSNANLDSGQRYGGRFMAGVWANDAVAFEAGAFFVTQDGTRLAHLSNPNAEVSDTVLARPFFDALNQRESALVVTAFNLADGRFDLTHTNRLWGAEANTHLAVYCEMGLRIALLGGLRYVDLQDDLTIRSISTLTGDGTNPLLLQALPFTAGSLAITDVFRTRNRWMGGQIGVQGSADCGRLFANGSFKVGAGASRQELLIAGNTTDGTFVDNGGMLALPSNIGEFGRTRWSFLNEMIIEVGYRITDCISVSAGYTFLYMNSVVRAGDQIERRINPETIPSQLGFNYHSSPQLPITQMDQTDFWAQGIQLGLSVKY